MDNEAIILALAALTQTTRQEQGGIQPEELARFLVVPHNKVSSNLAILTRAGLISGERQSRTITYRVALAYVREVIQCLLKHCCGGSPGGCAPMIADLVPCCPPKIAS